MKEKEKGPRIAELDKYIRETLKRYKEMAEGMADDRRKDWSALEEVFLELVMCLFMKA